MNTSSSSTLNPTEFLKHSDAATVALPAKIQVASADARDKSSSMDSCTPAKMSEATAILKAIENGDAKSSEQLLSIVYHELRRLAAFKMSQQAAGQTLQATALVHEAWLRLVGGEQVSFKNRNHFFSAAAEAMRHILIDRARRKKTQRHGGDLERVNSDDFDLAAPGPDNQLLAVNEALDKFAVQYAAQAEVVKLKYFAGMTNEEAAQLLGISVSTVKNYWNFSRAWLFKEVAGE
ncbi:MAG TPA: sigma-70 family RNA polymerase sigma factor [Verrucomicrobiae bacterium]|jgi:RNA polymerase sigma factor (TIGR02999 family)